MGIAFALLQIIFCSDAVAATARFAYRTAIPCSLVIADDNGKTIKSWPSDDARNLHWSPDGRWLMITANVANPGPDGPFEEILLIPPDGSQFLSLPDSGDLEHPAWMPSSDAVIAGDRSGIVSISTDGTKFSTLCPETEGFDIYSVRPSPDGKRWAIMAERNIRDLLPKDIYVSGPNCASPVKLTDEKSEIFTGDFGWSPDGKHLAFIKNDVIIVIDAEGKRRQEIKEGRHFAFDWTEDGRLLTSWDDGSKTEGLNKIGIVDPAGGKTVVLLEHPDPPATIIAWRPRPRAGTSKKKIIKK